MISIELLKIKDPQSVFLWKLKKEHRAIKVKLGFENTFVVNSLGNKGGLAML